jgi:hypothetical protein
MFARTESSASMYVASFAYCRCLVEHSIHVHLFASNVKHCSTLVLAKKIPRVAFYVETVSFIIGF